MPPSRKEPANSALLGKLKEKGAEIIIVKGLNPSLQRNQGVKASTGEVIYFLDEDSFPSLENLEMIRNEFGKSGTDILGGPSVIPDEGGTLEEVFYNIFSTNLVVGRLASRYKERGKRRRTDEGELILCNMAVRRSLFDDLGGFAEDLYPNEENEFIQRALKKKANVIYEPSFTVKKTLDIKAGEFIALLLKYGRGRGMQTRRYFKTTNILKLAPVLFIPVIAVSLIVKPLEYIFDLYLIYLLALSMVLSGWSFLTFFHYLLFIPATHMFYGLGILAGLFSKAKRAMSTETEMIRM